MPMRGAAELIHDTRDMPYTYKEKPPPFQR